MALEKSKLVVTIEVEGGDANKALKQFGDSLGKVESRAKKSNKEVSALGEAMNDLGARTVVINQALELAGKAVRALGMSYAATAGEFAKFETAINKVRKTANLTEKATERFGAKMQTLGSQIPIAANALGEFASLGAQLGVRGSANLEKFADTIGRVTVTTDLMGEHASLMFARILNVTGEGIGQVDRFASAVVALGNKYATGEAAILAMSNEIARSTRLFKLSSAEIAGLSTALKELGNRAEIGGTAVGKTFLAIQEFVNMGGSELERFAQSIGTTGQAFKKTFEEDSAKAFVMFMEGMRNMIASSGSAKAALEGLGLAGQGIIKVITPLTEDVGRLKEIMALSQKAFEENKALMEESQIVFGSLASMTQIMRNAFIRLGVNVGKIVAPAFKSLFETIAGGVNTLANFIGKLQKIDFEGIASQASVAVGVITALTAVIYQNKIATVAMNAAWAIWNGQLGVAIARIPVVGSLILAMSKKMWAFIILGGKIAIIAAGIASIVLAVDFLITNFKKLGTLAKIVLESIKHGFFSLLLKIKEADMSFQKFTSSIWKTKKAEKAIKSLGKEIDWVKKKIRESNKQQLQNLVSLKLTGGLAGKLKKEFLKLFETHKEGSQEAEKNLKDMDDQANQNIQTVRRHVFVLEDINTLLSEAADYNIDPFGNIKASIVGTEMDNALGKMELLRKKAEDLARQANRTQQDFGKAEKANQNAIAQRFKVEQRAANLIDSIKKKAAKTNVKLGTEAMQIIQKQKLENNEMLADTVKIISEYRKGAAALGDSSIEAQKNVKLTGDWFMAVNVLAIDLERIAKIQAKIAQQKGLINTAQALLDLTAQESEFIEDKEALLKRDLDIIDKTANIRKAELEILREQLRLKEKLSDKDDERITKLIKQLGLQAEAAKASRIMAEPVTGKVLGKRGQAAVQQIRSNAPEASAEAARILEAATIKSGEIWKAAIVESGETFKEIPGMISTAAGDIGAAAATLMEEPSFLNAAEVVGRTISSAGEVVWQGAKGAWQGFTAAGKTVVNQVKGVGQAIGKGMSPYFTGAGLTFIKTLGVGLSQFSAGFTQHFPAVMGAVNDVVGKMSSVATDVSGAIKGDLGSLGSLGGQLAGGFVDIASGFFSGSFAGMLKDGLQGLMDLPSKLMEIFGQLDGLMTSFIDQFPQMAQQIMEMIPVIIQKIMDALPQIITVLMDALGDLVDMVPNLFQRIISKVPELITMILGRLPELIKKIFEAIPLVVTAIIRAIPGIVIAIVDAIPDIIEAFVSGFLGAVGEIAVALIDTIIRQSPRITIAMTKAIPKIVVALVRGIVNGLKRGLTALFKGIKIPAPEIVDTGAISDKLKGAMDKVSKMAKKANEEIFSLIDLDNMGAPGKAAGMGEGLDMSGALDTATERLESIFSLFSKQLKKAWMWVYKKVLEPIIKAFKKVFDWVYKKIFKPILTGIRDAFMWVWENVFKPILDGIASVFTQVYETIFKPIIGAFQELFGALYETTFKPILDAFGILFDGFSENVKTAFAGVKDIFDGIRDMFVNVFGSIKENLMSVVEFVKAAFMAPIKFFKELFKGNVKEAFQVVTDLFDKLKDTVATAFKPVTDIFEGLKDVFERSVKPLKDIFGGMKETFKAAIEPLKNLFDMSKLKAKFKNLFDSLNPGKLLEKVFNIDYKGKGKVEKAVGIDIPFAKFAQGGMVPGFANMPGDSLKNDIIPALLSPGERVVPRSALQDPMVAKLVDTIIKKGGLPKYGYGISNLKKDAGSATGKLKKGGGEIAKGGKSLAKGASEGLKDMDVFKRYQDIIENKALGFVDTMLKANALHKGGTIKGYANGGLIDDQIIAAQSGEFVVKKASVSSIGLDSLNTANATGSLPGSGGATTNSVNISEGAIKIEAGDRDATSLVSELLEELKRRSLDGEFVISSQGIRAT